MAVSPIRIVPAWRIVGSCVVSEYVFVCEATRTDREPKYLGIRGLDCLLITEVEQTSILSSDNQGVNVEVM